MCEWWAHPEWNLCPVLAFPSEQGMAWEGTKQFAAMLAGKGIRCELDLWGHDVPHDWPSWRAQVAHHMPRFC